MATTSNARIGAAIDIGSNSVHLLVARGMPSDAGGDALEVLTDESELLGLGDIVDRTGEIPASSRGAVVAAVLGYLDAARAAGAQQSTLIGTEPLRQATNAPELTAEIERATGLPVHVLSARVEAELTFLGVVGGRLPATALIVVDIGGGSTELSVHLPGRPLATAALSIGSARMTNALVTHDPPTAQEMELLHDAARAAMSDLPMLDQAVTAAAPRAVFVGGTATNLARLGGLTRSGLADDRATLADLSAAQVIERFRVRPRRAGQLAAGAAIVAALLDYFGLDEAFVSQASLRYGAIIAASQFGGEWPERLTKLVSEGEGQPGSASAAASH